MAKSSVFQEELRGIWKDLTHWGWSGGGVGVEWGDTGHLIPWLWEWHVLSERMKRPLLLNISFPAEGTAMP